MTRFAVTCLIFLGLSTPYSRAGSTVERHDESYELDLRIARDGVWIPSQIATLAAGEPTHSDLACPRCGTLRVHQRVAKFPGTEGERVLVELELFQVQGTRLVRLVAPTLGVWLGEPQSNSFKTDIGVLEISARVVGLGDTGAAPADVETIPADSGLNQWLQRPSAQPKPLI